MTKNRILYETRLSNNQLICCEKEIIGHRYCVILCNNDLMTAPIVYKNLLKSKALQVYADYIKDDVLELV